MLKWGTLWARTNSDHMKQTQTKVGRSNFDLKVWAVFIGPGVDLQKTLPVLPNDLQAARGFAPSAACIRRRLGMMPELVR